VTRCLVLIFNALQLAALVLHLIQLNLKLAQTVYLILFSAVTLAAAQTLT